MRSPASLQRLNGLFFRGTLGPLFTLINIISFSQTSDSASSVIFLSRPFPILESALPGLFSPQRAFSVLSYLLLSAATGSSCNQFSVPSKTLECCAFFNLRPCSNFSHPLPMVGYHFSAVVLKIASTDVFDRSCCATFWIRQSDIYRAQTSNPVALYQRNSFQVEKHQHDAETSGLAVTCPLLTLYCCLSSDTPLICLPPTTRRGGLGR